MSQQKTEKYIAQVDKIVDAIIKQADNGNAAIIKELNGTLEYLTQED